MKYLFSVACFVVIKYVGAQYDDAPPEGAYADAAGVGEPGNPFYEGGPPQEPPQQQQQHEQNYEPQQQQHQYGGQPPQYRQQYQQGGRQQNQGAGGQGEQFRPKSTLPFANGTFTIPQYYKQATTVKRVVKVNRRTYAEMIDILIKDGVLKSPRVIEAFNKVDRGYFVHPLEDEPYGFMVRKLGRGVFLEKPHFQSKILEIAHNHIQEGAKVLEIGSGSGFMSAVLAELAGKSGKVIALEHMKEVCEEAWDNVHNVRPDLIDDGRLQIRCRDGRAGLLAQAPFDVIYVSPYLPDIPQSILMQLKPGGRLICGIGKNRVFHRLVVVDRSVDGETYSKHDMGMENFLNPLINALDQNDNWLYQQSRRRIIEAKNQGFTALQLARKLKLFTKKSVDLRKLEDDGYKFIEF